MATSSIGNVRQLTALMAAHGVTRCVLCPGSRNAPLVHTLSQMPGMECRPVTDERSAGFAALGWAARTGAPVAVCVTSGSALLNLHPAVAEAFYRKLPLLVLSADRPASWIGQQDGQTLPQPGAFGSLVRLCVNLPESATENDWHANRLINEALLELRHRGGGPVHINIPLREPLFDMTEAPLPRPRVIRRTEAGEREAAQPELADLLRRCPRRLLLLGQLERPLLLPREWEGKHLPVVGEHLCNSTCTCRQPDTLIGTDPRQELAPDLLLTVGGCLLSKRLKKLLRTHPPREHWHLGSEGELVDTFCCLTRCLEGEPADLLRYLAETADAGDATYERLWQQKPAAFPLRPPRPFSPQFSQQFSSQPPSQLSQQRPSPFPRQLSPQLSKQFPSQSPPQPPCGMSLVGRLLHDLPRETVLHLGNSSAVRYAQLFPLPEGVRTVCNRGVNGIEGSLSAALGYAMGDPRLHLLLCGDLSFFYDMNALWMEGISPRVRILLLNNGGGGIFSTLPGMPENPCIEARHSTSAEGWARSCGFRYRAIRTEEESEQALRTLLDPSSESPVLVEAFTSREEDARLLRQFLTEH